MKIGITVLTICFSLSWANTGGALEVEDAENLVIYLENDMFGGTDKNYSNAVKLSWTSGDIDEYGDDGFTPREVPILGRWLSREGYQRNLGFSIGQNIYTPEDTDSKELVEDDRPYAGLLYVAFGLYRKNEIKLDTLELTLGVIGPASLAQDSQRLIHDILGIDSPRGWENQLENEPGFGLSWQRSWRMITVDEPSGWGWDFIPHVGITAGNISTYANTGFDVRFGYNIPRDFGTSLIRPAGNILAPISETDPRLNTKRDFGIVWFVQAEGRAVAYNVFLDGNTFEDSHRVDKEPFIADFSAGFSLVYKVFKLTYTHVYRTKEFTKQNEGQVFGSIALSMTF